MLFLVATTSLPAVDRPNADRWNAAHSRQFPTLAVKLNLCVRLHKSSIVAAFLEKIEEYHNEFSNESKEYLILGLQHINVVTTHPKPNI